VVEQLSSDEHAELGAVGLEQNPALFTDLYELTMAAVYHSRQLNEPATFELFVRELPPSRGYLVVCGVESALDYLERFSVEERGITYLESLGLFSSSFLSFLAALRFSGDVWAIPEGEVAFAGEPLLRVTAPLVEAQLVETIMLNCIGYETMVATNAARIATACADRAFVDFSARRSHGFDAALKAAHAAQVGGAASTSLVLAGQAYGLELSGTMAHSYVMRFNDEREAFASFARAFPGRAVLLLDTYDTREAARRVVELADKLRGEGALPYGVRLDSGDLDLLSRSVRSILDAAGLRELRIFASGNLDEYRVAELVAAGAPIDGFGIGTQLVASSEAPALDTAYKLVEDATGPKLKLSEGKATLPGRKQLHRVIEAGRYVYDVLGLQDETVTEGHPLLEQAMAQGTRTRAHESLGVASERCRTARAALADSVLALDPAPEHYEVRLTRGLTLVRDQLQRAHLPAGPSG
jgi:nicotinate phosphoribosyltransferase